MRREWLRAAVVALALWQPAAAVAQQDDRSYLTALLEDNLSSAGRQVVITGFTGALSSNAQIAELTIADAEGIWLTLRGVVLDWNRSALFGGRLSVDRLSAEEIVVARKPLADDRALPSPEAKGFSLPELPLSVEIGEVSADRIVLEAAVLGSEVVARLEASATLIGGEGRAALLLERTDDGPSGKVVLNASYANASRQLVLNLTAEESADGIVARLINLPGAPSSALTLRGAGPINAFAAEIALQTDGQDRLAGQLSLQGTAEGAQRFGLDLAGNLVPLFLPAYAEFFGPQVTLGASGVRTPDGRVELDRLAVKSRALSLDGTLALAPDGLPERFSLTGQLGLPDGSPVLLPVAGNDPVRVEKGSLALNFDASRGDEWGGQAVLEGFDRVGISIDLITLAGDGHVRRATTGNGIDAAISFSALGLRPDDPAVQTALGPALRGTLALDWQEGAGAVSVPRFTLDATGYGLAGAGKIEGVDANFALTGNATARVDELSRLADLLKRPVTGAAELTLAGTGSPLAGTFDITASVEGTDLGIGQPELDALLRGGSRVDLAAVRGLEGTEISRLAITAATLTATAEGTLATQGAALTAEVAFRDLSVLGSGYRGALSGSARFDGTVADGTLALEAKGRALGIGQAQVDSLLAEDSEVSLEAGLANGEVDLRRLVVTAAALNASITGRLAQAGSDVRATASLADLGALGGAFRGSLQADAAFTGTPDEGSLTVTGVGQDLAIGQQQADRVLRGTSRVDLALDVVGGEIKIRQANLTNPQLGISATGTLADGVRQIDLSAQLGNLADLMPEFPGALSVTGTATQDASGFDLNLRAQGPGQIAATVAGRVANDFGTARLTMAGTAQAALANGFLDPRSVSGPLRFDLSLNGPFRLSSLAGQLVLADGRISDAGLPFSLQDVDLGANLAGGQAQIDATAAVSTGGRVQLTGRVGIAAPYVGDLTATLQQVVLRDPQLYETRGNGTVTITGPLTGGALIGGRVVLIETDLRIPSTGFTTSGAIADLQHVNEPAEVRATRQRAGLGDAGPRGGAGRARQPFGLDLTLSAPNRVFIRGRGLDAELGGELVLRGTTNAIIPAGSFDLIRGRLDILGQRLTLTDANLQLEGDFIPYVAIDASIESDEVISTVSIIGQATNPTVTFTSVPELPQEEVLARLLFGRALDQLSILQVAQLANAVAVLAGRGGEGVIGRLRQGFGLDDLDLVTDASGNTALRFGKYLSRKLYTEVELGQKGQTEINLNLDVTKSITLRGSADSDGTTGLGVFLEKDY